MNRDDFFKFRLCFTGIVTIAIGSLLTWNYFNGGVPSHHLLADKDLPAISNAWGALLLPLLSWFLLYRIQKKAFEKNSRQTSSPQALKTELYGFLGALLFGILLSFFFASGYPDVCGYLVLALIPIAVLFPVYRAGCLLGFLLGMTVTFGAVLPTIVGTILNVAGLLLYQVIRPGLLFIVAKMAILKNPSAARR